MNNLSRVELERCVAGSILIDNKNIQYFDISTDDIEQLPAKMVIETAKELGKVDIVLAVNHAKEKGFRIRHSELAEIANSVPTSKNFVLHLRELKKAIYRSKLDRLKLKAIEALNGDNLAAVAETLREEQEKLKKAYLEACEAGDLIGESLELLKKIETGEDNKDLIPTGIKMLDDMFAGGLLPNELIIIAARPSAGKTALGLQIALQSKLKVCFFSLEMSKEQIASRLLSSVSLMSAKEATRRPSSLDMRERVHFLNHRDDLLETARRIIVVDEHDQTIESIRAVAKKEVENGAKMIIVDYLQLLDCRAESRERAIGIISRGLKNMSKELDVPVICLAQMNRSIESQKRLPRLSDLRESGAIEQDANAVLFIHRTGTNQSKENCRHREVALILAKGRDVGEGFKAAMFDTHHQKFYEKAAER